MYFCHFISKFHFWNDSQFHKNMKSCDEAVGLTQNLAGFGLSTHIICYKYYCGDLAEPNDGNIVKNSAQVENAQETLSSHYISISRAKSFSKKLWQLCLQLRQLWLIAMIVNIATNAITSVPTTHRTVCKLQTPFTA